MFLAHRSDSVPHGFPSLNLQFVALARRVAARLGVVATALSVACGGDGQLALRLVLRGRWQPPMAMAVEAIALAPKPVERTTEYVATVKSRRSTTIQPQVEGFITSIAARPGQRVSQGTVLMQIDAGRQQAAVANLESMRAAREADVQFARQQAERQKKLFDAGAVSQQEYEQAATLVQTTEAQLSAVDAQIREQHVELALSPRHGADGGHRRRHPGARRRPRHALDDADDGRRERGARALHQRAGGAGAPDSSPALPVRIVDDGGQSRWPRAR